VGSPSPRAPGGFWTRGTLALGLALYAWLMMGIELYLHSSLPGGPERGLALFRRAIMGRAVVGVGAAAALAALVLGGLALAGPRHRGAAAVALALAAGFAVCLAALWPV
jgi:hypothetical protein